MIGLGIYNSESPTLKQDTELIEENITRILLTSPGERVCNPTFGCKLKAMIFDLSATFIEEVKGNVYSAVTKWEPRVNVTTLDITVLDYNMVGIYLECQVKETLETFSIEKVLTY